ncbi:GntT/GntP/DsdX family permease [Neobacillus cucumis]|uniref:GntT/GntP/DsdX family permease n=1 Tax=Neobacillus cucumis TaxID=1740721 RepID=UPI001965A3D7|nr:gluconate:H+ symporter [Neobacillus cucumis]MBM7652139.1 GntP family gluconate:H+ symporter [Neobacillus cucumis]
MTGHDISLLIVAVCSILLLVLLIVSKLRFHPMIALLVVAVCVGFASGLDTESILNTIEEGAGGTLGGVGLQVALGAMIGKLLGDSGASDQIASTILKRSTNRTLPWLMGAVAFIIGIPMFFEVGLIMLLPLVFTVAAKVEKQGNIKGSAFVLIGVPVVAALATMHGMVPPHPGPLTAIAGFKSNLGVTMIYGTICAIPAAILGGPVYAKFIAPRMTVRPDQQLLNQYTALSVESKGKISDQIDASNFTAATVEKPVSPVTAFIVVLLPMLMMLSHTLAETLFKKSVTLNIITGFIGEPFIALLIGLIVGIILLGYGRGADTQKIRDSLGASLKPIAGILLIIAGGGAFAKILVNSHVGDAIIHLSSGLKLSAIAIGWLIAALLSVTTGSATVGIVGATGLLAPLVGSDPHINKELLVVAIGAGSLFFNYANHAGFWLVKESFSMSMGETFKTITIIQSIIGIVGLIMALLLNLLPHF